jgi:hypothetical protein
MSAIWRVFGHPAFSITIILLLINAFATRLWGWAKQSAGLVKQLAQKYRRVSGNAH